jgi:hypothetical protein
MKCVLKWHKNSTIVITILYLVLRTDSYLCIINSKCEGFNILCHKNPFLAKDTVNVICGTLQNHCQTLYAISKLQMKSKNSWKSHFLITAMLLNDFLNFEIYIQTSVAYLMLPICLH